VSLLDNSFIFEILKDDPENIDRINATLQDIKHALYTNVYNAQRAISVFYQTSFKWSTHRRADLNRIVFDINYTYVEHRGRNKFRASNYYKKEISSREIFNNPDIFSKCILVFINGNLTNNFYVYFNEDKMEIRFIKYISPTINTNNDDGFIYSDLENFDTINATVTVVIMPICKRSIGSLYTNDLKTRKYNISEYDDIWTPSSGISVGKNPILFIGSGNFLSYNNISRNNNVISIDSSPYEHITSNDNLTFNMLYPANLLVERDVSNDGWFTLPIMNMPIPKENILIFKKPNYSNYELDYNATLEYYYPNKYRIVSDHENDYRILVFYNDDVDNLIPKHKNELSLYMKFMPGIDKYIDGTVPEYIKDYEPIKVEYDIPDYLLSSSTHLEYKINKLRELIYSNPDLYKYYLNKYVDVYPSVHVIVDAKTYNDRIRHNTSNEIPDSVVTFDTARYMFSMVKENNAQTFRLYIDNKIYIPTGDWIYDYNGVRYFYVPIEYVNIGSHIEVQKVIDNRYERALTVKSTDAQVIILDRCKRIKPDDIYITYKDPDSDIEHYLTNYKLCEKLSNDRTIDDTDIELNGNMYREAVGFNFYQELYIIWDNDTLDGYSVTIRANKYGLVFSAYNQVIKGDIEFNTSQDNANMVIYRDGRLMSPRGLKVIKNNGANGPHNVKSLVVPEDVYIAIEHMPEKYNLVCEYNDDYVKRLRIYQRYLDTDNIISGREDNIYDKQIDSDEEVYNRMIDYGHFVDLTNLITKPLDFKWYDIYMNGLKLTDYDVTFVSPYQMIIHLEDDYPDIDEFIMMDFLDFIKDHVIPLPFINPDLEQITPRMIAEYPEMMDYNTNVVFDSDTVYTMYSSILLNPDVEEGFIEEDKAP
jgi:hypothetical protein